MVLFAGGLAVSLANRETPDEVVAGPAGEVRIVPFDEAALVGEWVALDPTDQIDGEVTVAFRADGTYTQTGCNGASGQWLINRGHLTIGGGPTPSRACPGTGLQAVDSTFASGVPTLYSDGLLHFATDSFALDLVRTDAAPPADPTAPRPPAPTPTPTDMATVAGLWVVADVEPDGTPIDGSLQLDADGDTLFDGCGQDPGRWSVEAGRVVLQFYSGGGGCPDETLELISDHPVYTDADQLLLIDRNYGGGGAGVTPRARSRSSAPAPPRSPWPGPGGWPPGPRWSRTCCGRGWTSRVTVSRVKTAGASSTPAVAPTPASGSAAYSTALVSGHGPATSSPSGSPGRSCPPARRRTRSSRASSRASSLAV